MTTTFELDLEMPDSAAQTGLPIIVSIATRLLLATVAICASSIAVADVEPLNVSMIRLIATPEKFHGQTVRLTGYCNFEFEGDAIYLHTEDYSHANLKNSLWLNLPATKPTFARGPCLVQGKFDATDQGHFGMHSGAIGNITRLEPWPERGQ